MSAVLNTPPVVETAVAGYRLSLRRFARNRLAVAGLVVVVLFLLFCFAGPLLYATDQTHTDLTQVNLAPSVAHLLGTDAVEPLPGNGKGTMRPMAGMSHYGKKRWTTQIFAVRLSALLARPPVARRGRLHASPRCGTIPA